MIADAERHRAQAASYIQIAKLMTNEATAGALRAKPVSSRHRRPARPGYAGSSGITVSARPRGLVYPTLPLCAM
jgi:hypothetical protein